MMLAQINLGKEKLGSPFPEKGMLQFFIDVSDKNYGFDENDCTSSRGHRVIYHSKIDSAVKANDVLSLGKIPVSTDGTLEFSPVHGTEFTLSFRQRKAQKDESKSHHHLLGFPHFSGKDPRSEDEMYHGKKYDTVLFELKSEMYEDILWGDGGSGIFLINRDDLLKKDFSDVLFVYDRK